MLHLPSHLRSIVENDLPPGRFEAVERRLEDSIEITVGRRLAERMTTEQLDEFESHYDAGKKAALQFPRANLPHYPDVVRATVNEHLAVVAAAHHIGLLDLP